jgi:Kef-type K+ transport system membrane component KefB
MSQDLSPAAPSLMVPTPLGSWKFWLVYISAIVGAVFIVVLICQWGERTLTASSAPAIVVGEAAVRDAVSSAAAYSPKPALHLVAQLMFALASVLIVGRALGAICEYFQQPSVIGEVLAGIALGPSLLGAALPLATQTLFPATVMPALGVIAQLGVILYMLGVGLEFDISTLASKGHQSLAISHGSIILPFVLGCTAAIGLYPTLAGEQATFTPFVLFVGVSLSITAFPVLARILTDRGMSRTPLGVMALTCAAADDVTAWCLLAIVVGIVQSSAPDALWVVAGAGLYSAVMILAGRPLLRRFLSSTSTDTAESNPDVMTRERVTHQVIVLLALGLVSAGLTDVIGIHALFGAFLFGALIPHQSTAGKTLAKLLAAFAPVMLPAFFAVTGLRTQIGLLSSPTDLAICMLMIALAIAGKFGGSYLTARWTGTPHLDALRIGSLMNTRGLMELIVLNMGLELGVLSPKLFTMLVVMAIVTTMMTGPLLTWIDRKDRSLAPT